MTGSFTLIFTSFLLLQSAVQCATGNLCDVTMHSNCTACTQTTLQLRCSTGYVITGQIHTAFRMMTKNNESCNELPGDCLAESVSLNFAIKGCLWNKSSCDLTLSWDVPAHTICAIMIDHQWTPVYLKASRLNCVKANRVYDICHSVTPYHVALNTGSREPIYVKTHNYPGSYGSKCLNKNNTILLTVPGGYGIRYSTVDVSLNTDSCIGRDTLVMTWNEYTGRDRSQKTCGNTLPDRSVGTTRLTVHFNSVQTGHSNSGIMISFTAYKVVDVTSTSSSTTSARSSEASASAMTSSSSDPGSGVPTALTIAVPLVLSLLFISVLVLTFICIRNKNRHSRRYSVGGESQQHFRTSTSSGETCSEYIDSRSNSVITVEYVKEQNDKKQSCDTKEEGGGYL